MISYMVVRWNPNAYQEQSWHEARTDDSEERRFVSNNGGEVIRASIPFIRLAERVAARLDETGDDDNV
jgi:hypothetical protein